MAEIKENQMLFVDENGKEVLCDILFTYDSEEFGKSYVFFTPVDSQDENGNVEVGVSSYDPNNKENSELCPVETEEEWKMLEEVFQSFIEECDGCEESDCEHCPHCE